MKLLKTNAGAGLIAPFFVFAFVCFPVIASAASAQQFRAARVTRIIKNVQLLPTQAKPRTAAVNDEVNANTAVRTGTDSRTELTFGDLTITRLGANTTFSFNEGTREIELGSGAVLVQVPRNGAEMKISTAAVTAAVSGGTALFESNKNFPTKLLVMEGTGRFYPNGHPEQAAIVHGGEMVMMTLDGRITRPTKFNAAMVYKTSKLITSFSELPNADLIFAVIEQQEAEFSEGPSGPPSHDPLDETDQAIAAIPPSPAGGSPKFGRPAAITQPNPYLIMGGTLINTDPTITTNGITNFGKIYRGADQDGPLATWLGSSPSTFDSVDFFDNNGGGFNNPSTLPIPAFLFAALQLDGDPMVSNTNGYPLLGLVSQGDLTSSASGAVFTFGGMQEVGLVALNGSINLSGISFANFGDLFIYARGTGSSLTLAAPINLDSVTLRAEGDLQVNAPVTLTGTVPDHRGFKAVAGTNFQTGTTINSNQIKIQSLGGINIQDSAQLLSMLDSMGNSGQILIIAEGSNVVADIRGSIQAEGEVDIRHNGINGNTDLNNVMLNGDVVKISALGTNGVVNIGTGNALNADTVIKLYAPGSNGMLNFLSDVTLTSPSNIFAAKTITISTGVLVTINSPSMAEIYTDVPNYNFVPQPGYNGPPPNPANGSFGGAGAKDPQPLANRPPLGAPGTGP